MQRLQQIGRLGILGAFAVTSALAGSGCGSDEVAPPPVAEAEVEAEDEGEWEENTVPVISWVRLEPDTPAAGASVKARARVEDPDGDEIELGYAWTLNGRPARTSGDTLQLSSAIKGDIVQVTVTASDGWDESDPVTTQAQIGNSPPVLQNVAFDPLGSITRGQPVTARPIAIDPNGDPLEYEFVWWVNDRELPSRTDQLDTSRLKRGDMVRVAVVATDGYARSNEIRSEPIPVQNSAPQITSTPANSGPEGSYVYQVEAQDPDGDRRLRFRLEQAPAGMTIDPIGGQLSWTPPSDATGTHTIEVVVDDMQGGVGSQRFSVVIGDPAPEEPAPGAPGATPAAGEAPAPASPTEDR